MRKLLICLIAALAAAGVAHAQEQRPIRRVERMPDLPQPLRIKDWKRVARGFDRLAFDPNARGEHLPLIWWDDSHANMDRRGFGLPSYVGSSPEKGPHHEGVTCLAALLGATVAGIDKTAGEHNWVLMAEGHFNSDNGQNLVLNGIRGKSGGSFWYDLYPHYLFYGLADRYPKVGRMEEIVRITADRWRAACVALGGRDANFNHTAFDFEKMQPVDNGRWTEPDAAGAIAWIEYAAWQRYQEPKYLEAAEWCLQFLNRRTENPHYEALMPMGALAAARMNAELGRNYDLDKMLNWCFEPSQTRPGWGVIAERWGELDCHGLVGSVTDGGGYAFAMNTFEMAALLVPVARYDERYARAIGKWMLNAANAARLFYADELPATHQSCPDYRGDPGHVIAYEGLRKEGVEYARRTPRFKDQRVDGKLPPELETRWKGIRPFALGDPSQYGWAAPTDFGLYGAGCVGFFAGIISPTEHEGILQLDLLATDFFRAPAYPTYLYFNPHDVPKEVRINVGGAPRDLYDTVGNRFLRRQVAGEAAFLLPAGSARVIVLTPPGKKVSLEGTKLRVDGVVVDFNAEPIPEEEEAE